MPRSWSGRALVTGLAGVLVTAAALPAAAETGICDSNPPASTQACIDAIQANGGAVINDVFTDANGLTAAELPLFGTFFDTWPGCSSPTAAGGCAGTSFAPYDCPGQYTCSPLANTFANASNYLNALDRQWWQPCRLADPSLVNGCPNFQAGCIADGLGGNYYPWHGLVFDLGGPSNKVAIFAQNDHGPQPCESMEYTVYLTDNPLAHELTDLIPDPAATGVDPMKWNRAVLTTVFTKGFTEVRAPDPVGHAACGDTALYSVEEDSFVQVFALPCGITFRYASIIAGNDGLDFPECAFDSQEAELDAVAGLTESGAAVCPDADDDHYVDCNCPGAPPVCDCADSDPGVHPGAPEACDSLDLDCDGVGGSCAPGLTCYLSLCLGGCDGENQYCPAGATCQPTGLGDLCVPEDCSVGGCPPGGVCKDGLCVPACTDVSCPGTQVCLDGACVDPCANLVCPEGQTCQAGECRPPCACFAGDAGCAAQPGTVCDRGASNLCVPPACVGVECGAAEVCDPDTGTCVPFCNADVICPALQKCLDGVGCVPLCEDVVCSEGLTCNTQTGECEDKQCEGVTCFAPQVCVAGECVDPGSSSSGAGGDAGSGGNAPAGAGGSAPPVDPRDPGEESGCGCRTTGGEPGTGLALAGALVAFAAALARRRRR